jgi:TRAP-type C4-dicarboxylate transport system permease small subunit
MMLKPSVRELILRIIGNPLETAICSLFSVMVVVIFSQVVARYVFQYSLSWSEELARFMLMWLSMLSAAYAFKTKSHFALRFVVARFPVSIQKSISIFSHGLVALFLAVLCYYSVQFVVGVEGFLAPALQIPMQIPYASSIVGCALMLYYVLKNAYREFNDEPVDSD